jgi:hypothetical protein
MRKSLFVFGSYLLFSLAAGFTWSGEQLQRQVAEKVAFRHITSVSQNFDHAYALYLIVDGTNLPPKNGANGITRYIRLVPWSARGAVRGPIHYMGNTGNWSPSRIDDFVPIEVVAGRRYKVGLIETVAPGPSPKTLISNEIEYLLLMKLETVTPNPVPQGTAEIEVNATNLLGPQGQKVVRIGGQAATVTQWIGTTTKFRVRIPAALAVPAIHELFIEESGTPVSNKAHVRLLGPSLR